MSVPPGTDVSFSTVPVLDDRLSFAGYSPGQNADDNKDATHVAKPREVIPGLSALQRTMNPSYKAPVTEQPAGTEMYYIRSGKANYCDDSSVYTGDQSGVVTVVENGNTVWFKNLFYDPEGNFPVDYWVQGTKSGNVITVSLPQDIDATTYSGYTVQMAWGTTRVSGSSLNFTKSSIATAYFDIDNDGVLTLRNATYPSSYAGNGLHTYVQAGNTVYYQYMSLFTTTLTPAENIPEAPVMYTDDDINAMDGELVEYNRTGYTWFPEQDILGQTVLDLNEQKGTGYIFYDEDGTTVYMRDPVYGWSNGMWIKGTKDGNQLTFPLGQYLYWDEDFFGLKTAWGTMVVSEDNYMNFTEDIEVTDVTFTIEGDRLTMNGCGMPDENSYTGLALMTDSAYIDLGWYGDLDFWTHYYDIPATPTNVTVEPGSTTANVGWSDDVNSKWNVRYREWVDASFIDCYICDFEDTTAVSKWWGLDYDTDNRWWVHCLSLKDGNKYLASASYINDVGPLTPDNWLISPEVKLDGIVKFTAWGADAEWYKEVFKVYLFVGDSATISDENDFVAISDNVTTTSEKTEYTYAIPDEYQGQMGYIAIRHYSVYDQFWLCLGDFYVGDPDAVPQWIYLNGVELPNVLLAGLSPETTYEVQVQGVNAGGAGSWTDITQFSTTALPLPPIIRGDVNGNNEIDMDDLTLLINYLLSPDEYLDFINFENAAICNSMESELVGMDDLTALINYLLTGQWDN